MFLFMLQFLSLALKRFHFHLSCPPMLYKLYNTEEIEHNVWIFPLPPLLTVLQGPWRRINYIHRILIVNRYMYSVYCTTIKLIQILQFALNLRCNSYIRINIQVYNYLIYSLIFSWKHIRKSIFLFTIISFIALSSIVNTGPFKNHYSLTRNKQIHIYSII